jgi:hypothetical protein
MADTIDWRPMADFDPSKLGQQVHDRLNDQIIDWEPERHGKNWDQHGYRDFGGGIVEWDGLLLDGWRPSIRRAPTELIRTARRRGQAL